MLHEVNSSSSCSDVSEVQSADTVESVDEEFAPVSNPPSAKKSRSSRTASAIITPAVAAAFDRTKLSNRSASYILAANAQSLGHDPADITLNRQSVRQARRKHREAIARDIQATFTADVPLTVHWDGKMLPSLTSKDNVDRLAILVSGEGVMKLLGVPRLPNGAGDAEASAVFNQLIDWNIAERVKFMSFDTTAANTGLKAGACVLLEQKLQRKLLPLACRHHIHELIVAQVFHVLLEPATAGPKIKLFERFAENWCRIDKEAYESGIIEESVSIRLQPVRDNLVSFLNCQLLEHQPRDDYKELLNLALVFLGAPPKGIRIIAPGAMHRARWMAKLIYCLKIYLFRSQFILTGRELSGLMEFNIFVIQIYLKAWYTCQSPALAPRKDLQLLKQLWSYKTTNESVAMAAIQSFTNHLWYLSETMIGLALFDDEVPNDMKIAIVSALEQQGSDVPIWCLDAKEVRKNLKAFVDKDLNDFVTLNTKQLFIALDIPLNFLHLHPSRWDTNGEYMYGRCKINSLKVVNDAAERGVALVQSFNALITNQEEQKQYLLQVVEQHRKEFPNANKATIIQGLSQQ